MGLRVVTVLGLSRVLLGTKSSQKLGHRCLDQAGAGEAVSPETALFPLFGRLRRDGFNVNSLAGVAGDRPIVRPMELTAVGDSVGNLREAVVALKNAVEVR
eukprot:2572202-Pyramimonas_sp.AAC.1